MANMRADLVRAKAVLPRAAWSTWTDAGMVAR